MNESVDVYRIARLLLEEHGVFATDEVQEKIQAATEAGDYNSTKIWYEIEDALNEIQNASASEKESEDAMG